MTRFSEIDKDMMDFLLQTVPQSPAYLTPRHDLHDIAVACYAELKDELKLRNSAIRTTPLKPSVTTTTEDPIVEESAGAVVHEKATPFLTEKPRNK
jgi:hypothetical protein